MQVAFHLFLPLVLLNEMQMAEYSTIFSTLSSSFQKIHHDIAVSLSFLTCHFFIDSCNSFFRTQFCQAMCECPACDFSLALWSVENPYRFQFQSYHFFLGMGASNMFLRCFLSIYTALSTMRSALTEQLKAFFLNISYQHQFLHHIYAFCYSTHQLLLFLFSIFVEPKVGLGEMIAYKSADHNKMSIRKFISK